jgi:nucleoside-diphosphate-sugar epimerase
MRILIVGATGVLGRATLPHLAGHDVTGTTRAADKRASLASIGARAEICDVYEAGALERLARACAPEVIVNFLSDLALEDNAVTSGLDAVILRFGRFWGPGTWTENVPAPPAIHVAEAGRRAAALILAGSPGLHVIVEPPPS